MPPRAQRGLVDDEPAVQVVDALSTASRRGVANRRAERPSAVQASAATPARPLLDHASDRWA